jgi:NADPH-dependent 2,4-dienoyl-CoA reductase/sulfur reductase-like enzyme
LEGANNRLLMEENMVKKSDLVIVGGTAGTQAAIVAQRHHNLKSITVIRAEENLMVPCGIPYIYGTLGAVDRNIIPDTILGDAELMIDKVTSIDRDLQVVTTSGGKTIGYNKLLLATGSLPVVLKVPGIELKNVFFVRKEAGYLQKLKEALDGAKNAVVIGGGFIGVEFADECRKRGLEVTIVELLPHCLQLVCSEELCIRVENVLQERGIRLITGNRVCSVGGVGKAEYVELQSGEQVKADVVIVGIGVAPNTELAQKAGLEIGEQKGIKVDEYMRTSDPNVFAAGDCAEKVSFFTGKPVALRLASIAVREAKIAAVNLFGPQWRNEGTIGVFSTVIGDVAITVAGLDEKRAKEAGFDIVTGEAAALDKHPGTMSYARELRAKLIFDRKSGKMIGGQACCVMTAGEIGNLMAAAIISGMRIEQVATFPMGTHPALTASPLSYQLTEAACQALAKLR